MSQRRQWSKGRRAGLLARRAGGRGGFRRARVPSATGAWRIPGPCGGQIARHNSSSPPSWRTASRLPC